MRCEWDGSVMTQLEAHEASDENGRWLTIWRCPWCRNEETEATTQGLLQREWERPA